MIYEWRTYAVTPGTLPVLRTHREVATSLCKKHGPGALGFWIEEIGARPCHGKVTSAPDVRTHSLKSE